MRFELLPVLDIMLEFYEKPRNIERFQSYLNLLHGQNQNDLALPLAGFNPMAYEHVHFKLLELQTFQIEKRLEGILNYWNARHEKPNDTLVFRVAFNLADDLKGGWTNRFTTDYENKFNQQGLVNLKFCTPLFWVSERYSPVLIEERTLAALYRTKYRLDHGTPKTLIDHVRQERFIARHATELDADKLIYFDAVQKHFFQHASSDNYPAIFNFFYGDDASQSLGFPVYGVKEKMAGFRYCQETSLTLD
jgi:hypothetical protein